MDVVLLWGPIGLLVGLVMVAVSLVVASRRTADSVLQTKPKRVLTFVAAMPSAAVMHRLLQLAKNSRYSIEYLADEGANRENERGPQVVLGEGPSFATWGFFYPIYMTPEGDRRTLVEVGIKSKLSQFGPIVSRRHAAALRDVQAWLAADLAFQDREE